VGGREGGVLRLLEEMKKEIMKGIGMKKKWMIGLILFGCIFGITLTMQNASGWYSAEVAEITHSPQRVEDGRVSTTMYVENTGSWTGSYYFHLTVEDDSGHDEYEKWYLYNNIPSGSTVSYQFIWSPPTYDSYRYEAEVWGSNKIWRYDSTTTGYFTVLRKPTISSWSISPTVNSPGDTFTISYTVYNSNSVSISNVGFGCSIYYGSTTINDPNNDMIKKIGTGYNIYTRSFRIPSSASYGQYQIELALWDGTPGGDYRYYTTGKRDGGPNVKNNIPTLSYGGVSPSLGFTPDTFAFRVKYKDLDGDYPEDAYVIIYPSTGGVTAIQLYRDSGSPSTGAWYERDVNEFPSGTQEYYFWFSDGIDDVTYPSSGRLTLQVSNPTISIIQPSGGEKWKRDTSHQITWSSNIGGYVKIELLKGGSLVQTISSSTSNDGSFWWSIPSSTTIGSNYRIRISSTTYTSISSQSVNDFTISQQYSVDLTYPNGGETFDLGSTYSITWTGNVVGSVKLDLYRGSTHSLTITSSTPNDGIYSWKVPSTLTIDSYYRIKVSSASDPSISDMSSNYFSIKELDYVKYDYQIIKQENNILKLYIMIDTSTELSLSVVDEIDAEISPNNIEVSGGTKKEYTFTISPKFHVKSGDIVIEASDTDDKVIFDIRVGFAKDIESSDLDLILDAYTAFQVTHHPASIVKDCYYCGASLVLLADDWSGVGVTDDLIIVYYCGSCLVTLHTIKAELDDYYHPHDIITTSSHCDHCDHIDVECHSPIDMHVYDEENRHTGMNYSTGLFDEEIPNIEFSISDEMNASIYFNETGDHTYRIELVGTGNGSYSVDIRGSANGSMTYNTTIVGNVSYGDELIVQMNTSLYVLETPEMKFLDVSVSVNNTCTGYDNITSINSYMPTVNAGLDRFVYENQPEVLLEVINHTVINGINVTFTWRLNDGTYVDGNESFTYIGPSDDGNVTLILWAIYNEQYLSYNDVNITVMNVPPDFEPIPDCTTDEDLQFLYQVNANDVISDDLHFDLTEFPDGMEINTTSGIISWIPKNIQACQTHNVTLSVRDDDGGHGTTYFSIFVENANDAPICDAGPNVTIDEGILFEFNGSSSDPDQLNPSGDTLSYYWDFGDKTTSFGSLNPTHSYSDDGNYLALLIVIDSHNYTSNDTVLVSVLNVAPSVIIESNDGGEEGASIQFYGSYSDPGWNDSHSVTWDFGDGTSVHGTLSPTHIYSDNGIYSVNLTVTDDDGGTGWYLLDVTVSNVPPTVDVGSNLVTEEGSVIVFNGDYFDQGSNDSHSIQWAFGDGHSSNGILHPNHSFSDDGIYTITLTIIDDDGGVGVDTSIITVLNVEPQVNAGTDKMTNEGSKVEFLGTFSDQGLSDDHTIVWDFGDGYSASGCLNVSHKFNDNGNYTVTLTVTDDDGGIGTDSIIALIMNVEPKAVAGLDLFEDESLESTFTGNFTDPGSSDVHSYEWDFDYDGMSFDVDAEGLNVSHTWYDDFNGIVALRVTDDDGGSGIDTCNVTILNVAPKPIIDNIITPSDIMILPNHEVQLFGNFSDPGIYDTHTIVWDFGDGSTINTSLNATHQFESSGVYNITLTVTDDDGGTGVFSISIKVQTIADAIQGMIDQIEDLDLSSGIEKSFTTKLDQVLKVLSDNNPNNDKAAVNILRAFVNHAIAQSGKSIPGNVALGLIKSAQELMTLLVDT